MYTYNPENNYFKKFNNQTIVLTEKVNVRKLKYIVDNYNTFFNGFSNEEISEWFKQDKGFTTMECELNIELKKKIYLTKLTSYLQRVRNGTIKITYKQTKQLRGRYFCEGASYQNHMRQFRHTLIDGDIAMHDIDMDNAHPNLLHQYCLKHDIPCEWLGQYATNRDKFLLIVKNKLGYKTRGSQKQYLLKMLNGGITQKPCLKLQPLFNELKSIRMIIYNTHPSIKEYVIKKNGAEYYNNTGAVMNHLMCDLENQTLICIYNILQQNNIQVSTLCFDGLMIPKDHIDTNDIPNLLKFIQKEVYKTIGYDMKLSVKEMNEGFDIDPKLYKNVDISLYELDLSEDEINKHVEKCVYGDNSEYADFLYELYGKKNIKVYEYCKGDISFYHWNNTKKIHEQQQSIKFMKYIQLLRPHFQNCIYRFEKQLKRIDDKKTDEYKDLKKKIQEYKRGCKRLSTTSFKKCVTIEYSSFDIDYEIREKMDSSCFELPLKNGMVIDLRTREVRKRTQKDLFSFELDSEYVDESKDHIYDAYIKSLFQDELTERYVKKFVSYLLTSGISDRSFHCLYGIGCNGKSVFMSMIQNLMSRNLYKTLSSQALILQKNASRGPSPELIALQNPTRLVIVNELNENETIDSKLVKTITGSDEITVRQLYKEEVSFSTTAKIVIITNELPSIDISDQAMLDRLKFIPFHQRFQRTPESKKYLDDLKLDTSAMLSYFIRYYTVYMEEGLKATDLMNIATKKYLKDSNEVIDFVAENYTIINDKKDKTYKIKPKDVWAEYSEYTRQNKIKRRTRGKFRNMLFDLGVIKIKQSDSEYYLLKSTAEIVF